MKTTKIAFVIDGYYGLTLYKDIKKTCDKVINFEALVNTACLALGNRIGENCISPANLRHYYMGTNSERLDSIRNEYEDSLKLSRFGARGRPLKNGKEKGIDTMLFSDIKEEANAGAFDYLILLAGDLDHITLIQDLKDMGIKTVLMYGEIVTNGKKTTGCSQELKNACFDSVDLYELLDNEDIFIPVKKTSNSITEFMKGSNLGGFKVRSSEQLSSTASYQTPVKKEFPLFLNRILSKNNTCSQKQQPGLLDDVITAVKQVIKNAEVIKGHKLVFALQAQVGTYLKRNGIVLPKPLGEYLDSYPDVFMTGTHPVTQALTVSVRR